MRLILFFIFTFCFSSIFAQISRLENYPFSQGEIGTYAAIYKWGIIEIQAGEVNFVIEQTKDETDKCFQFKSYGNSLAKYDWIYRVRDTFQSIVNKENFQSIYYQRNTSEGSYVVNNETWFKPEKGEIIMNLSNSNNTSLTKMLKWQSDIFDLQTACYYARLLNFENATMGEEYIFKIIVDGQLYNIPIRYEGKEMIELNEKMSFNCYRISTKVIEGTIFKSNQTIKIWVSDDGRNIPVKVEAPIKVGQVKAELINYIEEK